MKAIGLRPQSMYEVRSLDAGPLGTLSGAALMADGIGIVTSPVAPTSRPASRPQRQSRPAPARARRAANGSMRLSGDRRRVR